MFPQLLPIHEQTQEAYHRRERELKTVNRGGMGLTSYWACKFRAFWLKKPKTLEKCSLRISLNTCERTRQKPLAMTELNQAPACLISTTTAQEGAQAKLRAEQSWCQEWASGPSPRVCNYSLHIFIFGF